MVFMAKHRADDPPVAAETRTWSIWEQRQGSVDESRWFIVSVDDELYQCHKDPSGNVHYPVVWDMSDPFFQNLVKALENE